MKGAGREEAEKPDPAHRLVATVIPGLHALHHLASLVRHHAPLHLVEDLGVQGWREGAVSPGVLLPVSDCQYERFTDLWKFSSDGLDLVIAPPS